MANKEQKNRTVKNKPKLSVMEKKERKARRFCEAGRLLAYGVPEDSLILSGGRRDRGGNRENQMDKPTPARECRGGRIDLFHVVKTGPT